ncbi:MAG: hypothetical protein AB7V56_04810 [Candidatus Nitrosocosmicus sp.]
MKREQSIDGNYINQGLAKSAVRIRFLPFVCCIYCGDLQCSVGGIDMGCNIPIVKCDNCEFIYHNKENSMDMSKSIFGNNFCDNFIFTFSLSSSIK